MKFTEEQKNIIELLKQGKSNTYISKKIFMSKGTLKRRLSEIYDMFGVEGQTARTDLIITILKLEKQGLF